MVSQDFQELTQRRVTRAEQLARHHASSAEALAFLVHVARFQAGIISRIDPRENVGGLTRFWPQLGRLIHRHGPAPLQDAVRPLTESRLAQVLQNYWNASFQDTAEELPARILLQVLAVQLPTLERTHEAPCPLCPRCGHPPQLAVLKPEADGRALSLACSLCFHQWAFPRGRCPSCSQIGEGNLEFYEASEFPHLQLQMCQACRRYLQVLDLRKDPHAVADVDELSALVLDAWAREQGFTKLRANLAGM